MSTPIPSEYSWVVISAVRYALGRATGIVERTVDLVRDQWAHLTAQSRQVIAEDIRQAITTAESRGLSLGMSCEHAEWTALYSWITESEAGLP